MKPKTPKQPEMSKQLARSLQLDFAALMWRRMLELNMTVEQLAAKTKLSVKKVSDLLHARDKRLFAEVGRIGVALQTNIRIVRTE